MASLQKTKPPKRKAAITKVRVQEVFTGPLPHPKLLDQYEHIFPGATERIFQMAERQQAHRQRLESAVIRSNIENERKGMYFSLVITLTVVLSGAILIALGHGIEGFVTLIATIAFHAYNFISQKKRQEKELEENREEES